MSDLKKITQGKSVEKFNILPFGQLEEQVKHLPKTRTIWAGIKEGSFGVIIGPSKSGKTTFCENLAISLVLGRKKYWGKPLYDGKPHAVAFISFEENCVPRYERAALQMKHLSEEEISLLRESYFQPDCHFPQSMKEDKDWSLLEKTIKGTKAKIVFVDSLTRLYSGAIEESKVAQKLTLKLREIARNTGITLISIHHTTKTRGKPITQDSMAGSRVISQEADFAIAIDKSPRGRYLKEVFYRYEKHSDSKVQKFIINDDLWLEAKGWLNEYELFKETDGRKLEDSIYSELVEFISSKHTKGIINTNSLKEVFVNTKKLSNPTLHSYIKRLISEKVLTKIGKGTYKLNEGKGVKDEE